VRVRMQARVRSLPPDLHLVWYREGWQAGPRESGCRTAVCAHAMGWGAPVLAHAHASHASVRA